MGVSSVTSRRASGSETVRGRIIAIGRGDPFLVVGGAALAARLMLVSRATPDPTHADALATSLDVLGGGFLIIGVVASLLTARAERAARGATQGTQQRSILAVAKLVARVVCRGGAGQSGSTTQTGVAIPGSAGLVATKGRETWKVCIPFTVGVDSELGVPAETDDDVADVGRPSPTPAGPRSSVSHSEVELAPPGPHRRGRASMGRAHFLRPSSFPLDGESELRPRTPHLPEKRCEAITSGRNLMQAIAQLPAWGVDAHECARRPDDAEQAETEARARQLAALSADVDRVSNDVPVHSAQVSEASRAIEEVSKALAALPQPWPSLSPRFKMVAEVLKETAELLAFARDALHELSAPFKVATERDAGLPDLQVGPRDSCASGEESRRTP